MTLSIKGIFFQLVCNHPEEKLRDQMASGQELDDRTGVLLPMDAQVIVSLFVTI